ncbi:MAG: hypothetical protein JXR11_14445 [Balneola sp.]
MARKLSYLLLLFLIVSCETTKDDTTIIDLGKVFVSSNTQSRIGIFNFSDLDNKVLIQYETTTDDAEGIYYDNTRDIVYQADRENNRINAYNRLSTNEASSGILPSAISTSGFSNPRGLTSDKNIAIVAQDASEENGQQNALLMYDISANEITLRSQFTVDFALWDIQLVGNTLYAVQDGTDSLAVFNNFLANSDGQVIPDFKIRIEGIVRTHGLYYSLTEDLMVMTDIGDVASGIRDGQIILIEDFNLKLSAALQEVEKTISSTDMIFINGANTTLQNPVDVVYHSTANRIIVAERTTNGGMLLAFEYPEQMDSSNMFNLTPSYSVGYNGISSLYINQ